MRILLTLLAICLLPALAMAQDDLPDSKFRDYAGYSAYVDEMVTTRQFIPFIQRMGGRDEYSPEQLEAINGKLLALFPRNFTNRTVFQAQDLGGGIRQEARAYWSGNGYVFFYAIMHDRADGLIVLNFALNTKVEAIMERF